MSRFNDYKNFEEPVSDIVPCFGPRSLLLNESDEDVVWAYQAAAKGEIPISEGMDCEALIIL